MSFGPEREAGASPGSRGAAVLVVDDNESNRDLLSRRLVAAGYAVASAASGPAALSALAEGRFDAVLLDVMMPEMDGWQVLRTLKADERTRQVPVVMLSARAERRDKMIGLQEGAEGYIAKPFSPSEVVREVQSFLERGT